MAEDNHKSILVKELKAGMIIAEGLVVSVNDWNEKMMQIVFCGWGYQGDVNKSSYFFLKSKDQDINVFTPKKKEKGKYAGEWYIIGWQPQYLYIQPNIKDWLLLNKFI